MLSVVELTKRYSSIPAVSQVSFTVEPGKVLGYLGPNGSGKSTTVKMLTGLLLPSQGHILYRGRDIQQQLIENKSTLGYVPEDAQLYNYLTGREYLQLVGRLRGLPPKVLGRKIDDFLQPFSTRIGTPLFRPIRSTVVRSADVGIERYDPPLLSIPLVMSFFVLCGLRFIFTVPAELNANWIFRLIQGAPPQEVLSGVRKGVWTFGVVPLPAGLFPFYAALWGVEVSLLHLIFVFTLAGILAEILLLRFQKVPFTCSYLPGKANLKLYWFPYVAAFSLYAYGMASLEAVMLEYPARFVIFYTAAFVVLCYVKLRRRQLPPSEREVIFEELPEPAVRSLNLSH